MKSLFEKRSQVVRMSLKGGRDDSLKLGLLCLKSSVFIALTMRYIQGGLMCLIFIKKGMIKMEKGL